MDSIEDYRRALEIQRKSRELAERQLEIKSRELYEKNKRLEKALDELKAQQQQLIAQERAASVGQLAAGLAHEINNPNAFVISNLSTLSEYTKNLIDAVQGFQVLVSTQANNPSALASGAAEICKEYDVDYMKQDAADLIRETEQGALRIKRIVQSLQYFSHQDPSQVKAFDLNRCVAHCADLVKKENNGCCEIYLSLGELPSVKGVQPLISQAVSNVVRNAVQANPRSGKVQIKTGLEDEYVEIRITDDGEGIAPEYLNCVFDPFYTTKDAHTGLGLTVSQAIVKQHHGDITLQAAPGETTVKIRLPI